MSKRIMLLTSSLNSGGAERVAVTLVNAWAERGYQVTLVATFSGRGECFYPVSNQVQLIYLADVAGKVGRSAITYGARFLALRRLIHKIQPDILVSFLTNVNVAAILATRGLRVPTIVCEHTNPKFAKITGRGLPLLRRLTYPLADLVTLLGHDMVPAFRVMVPGIKRLEVIANPLPNELLGINKTIVTEQNHYRVIAMGRLIASKQFSGLIESFASLAVDFPNWNLWIWGEGPLRMQLEGQIDRNGLNERVFLPGRTSTPWEELVKGEIFVLSSAYEGLPMALLEAMALKLPCVAFDCPSGPREITQGGQNALLVTLNDWQGLTEALRQLMSSFALREELGKKAAVSVRERYALDGILQRWDQLFSMVSP
ncbi:MAG: glycosyltransferase family 4 protein [Candidatus Competibacteraceae bacterium]|nr:glycosyltransferase family 4 protein [Candidatus Competibacteraceae bacterium]MBK8897102.1 glycosyltransferase family 4 protein [Candidatus Competibacteraceae bacterium]MBK8964584.1 glycosyltransferase family 4 protein [Candidatus Competibacteraceae bacterium]MBK9952580.1 glycosyltransferase family 4 protein [Candidatus Competibacteraceae bacterium]